MRCGIAERLFTTEQTVKDHMRSIFDKLGVVSRAKLMSKILWGALPEAVSDD